MSQPIIQLTLQLLLTIAACLQSDRAGSSENAARAFHDACAQQAAVGDSLAISGRDGWLFLRAELRHIGAGPFWGEAAARGSKASSPEKADPIPAICDFQQQLEALGVDLIVMPVPCKALIYPDKLGGPANVRVDTVHQEFFRELAAKGVTVLDLAGEFIKDKARPDSPPLYCATDSHWSPYACELTARSIKEKIGSPSWLTGKPDAFEIRQETRVITGDLSAGKGSEQLEVRLVSGAGAAPLEDKSSPIVLLGDSHTLVFHAGADLHGTGAGLADQLAAELGTAIDVVGVRGSGATAARLNLVRRARTDPTYLAHKKVVLWCFAAREFTEAQGWPKIPIHRGK
ncbi:MAG: hypothetical protein EHM42_03690 [Planctomycetaceae bacterium]|nr:MAG: hypothetical protein EHM42_03690 [Planctomycetaceae bacterium]